MWLYLFFPHLYLETVGVQQALAADAPCVIFDDIQKIVKDANAAAIDAGIEAGMNLPTALCLAPELDVVVFDEVKLRPVHARLLKQANDFSSWVAFDGEQGMYLEIASMQRLLGSPEQIAERLQAQFSSLTLTMASAPYARCARLLARAEHAVHLNKATMTHYLAMLPIESLPIEDAFRFKLKRLGIQQLGKLLSLKPNDIAYRIDAELADELGYVTGRLKWFPQPVHAAKTFHQHYELMAEIENAHVLLFPISKMLKQLEQFLRDYCLKCRKLIVKCHYRDAGYATLSLMPAKPTAAADEWIFFLKNKLASFSIAEPILRLELYSKWFERVKKEELDLLGASQSSDGDSRSALVNLLHSKIGEQAYAFLQYCDSPWPERRTQCTRTLQKTGWQRQENAPVFLLEHPLAVNRSAYVLLHGPDRIASGWWEDQACVRDYYVGRCATGQLHWLYRDQERNWFLHGYFS